MKEKIHPQYDLALVNCTCGNQFYTRSTEKEIQVSMCSACHPFFTGRQKLMDPAGRMEKFRKRFSRTEGKTVRKKPKKLAKKKIVPEIIKTKKRIEKKEKE